MQKPDRREDPKAESTPRHETPHKAGVTAKVKSKVWTRPDFTEASACAEICAYVFVA
ncbi:MAG: hypothetical protein HY909_23235 [Deltaproteobacteria bacterium]|nr:hypothetical protein [Deltaproteobacteria bacterium]